MGSALLQSPPLVQLRHLVKLRSSPSDQKQDARNGSGHETGNTRDGNEPAETDAEPGQPVNTCFVAKLSLRVVIPSHVQHERTQQKPNRQKLRQPATLSAPTMKLETKWRADVGELAGASFSGKRLGGVNWRKLFLGVARSAGFSRRPTALQWHPIGKLEDEQGAAGCIAERCAPESNLHPSSPAPATQIKFRAQAG